MQFKDIPKFKSFGNYRINVDIKGLPAWIEHMEEDWNLDLNPDFQRGHVWTPAQQTRYVEYLLRGGQSSREIIFNCPQWNSGNNPEPLVCVDGRQRITACLKFTKNELPVFEGHYLRDFEDNMPSLHYTLIICVNDLQTRKEVLEWYKELNWGGTVHDNKEFKKIDKLIKEC